MWLIIPYQTSAFAVGRCAAVGRGTSLLVFGQDDLDSGRAWPAVQKFVAYHEAELGGLVARVGEAVDRYRGGEIGAFDVDRVLFQYSRAAKELWKYCNHGPVEIAASVISARPPHGWWERGAPTERS